MVGEIDMETIEERAKEYAEKEDLVQDTDEFKYCQQDYIAGATEQKAIDEKEIKQLRSIIEQTASVLGIGTKWFNEDARRNAILKLKQEIFNYLKEY